MKNNNNILFCEKCQIHFFPNFEDYDQSPIMCSICNSKLVDTNISYDDYKNLTKTKRCKQCKCKYPKMFIKCPKCKIQLIKLSTENKNNQRQVQNIVSTNSQNNIPKCPTCGSTNVEPISTGRKAIELFALGLASKTVGKTYKCKNCGYHW